MKNTWYILRTTETTPYLVLTHLPDEKIADFSSNTMSAEADWEDAALLLTKNTYHNGYPVDLNLMRFVPPGRLEMAFYSRAGASPSQTDPLLKRVFFDFNGTSLVLVPEQ
ncbi:MAG TPA: hypothetical protein PLV55_10340 [Anaerohalosphaeraceae bacterium]|nr:hypothetical protein [Anaerohalosphaeraceae bacterium]